LIWEINEGLIHEEETVIWWTLLSLVCLANYLWWSCFRTRWLT